MNRLPPRRKTPRMGVRENAWIRSPSHLQWVRGFTCIGFGLAGHECSGPIVAAHVRLRTDGAAGEKPSDCWANPMCDGLHQTQHAIGEPEFEKRFDIDLKAKAQTFWRASPYRYLFADHPANPLRKDAAA
jgi:hypothetical protein